MWFNVSVATLNATLQFLVIYWLIDMEMTEIFIEPNESKQQHAMHASYV